ncbi:MAG TPA: SRPBCC family protein [Casimicrobiaceae bacterium]|nr:SRPBCC family protein [Casimicrobiaceae bacterium]
MIRLFGAREVASGLAILMHPDRSVGVKARLAGDALDLALLLAALRDTPASRRPRVAGATAAVLGVAALDALCAHRLERDARALPLAIRRDGTVRVEKTVAVNRAPTECYAMWRSLANLPRFMKHLESVTQTDPTRSHWVARGPGGLRVEWDAEITRDEPNQLLAWRSLEGSEIENAGAVRFLSSLSGRGSIVAVVMQYKPPAGALGVTLARLFGGEPQQHIEEDLRRFRQIMETGEVPTTEGQPAGRRGVMYRMLRKRDSLSLRNGEPR